MQAKRFIAADMRRALDMVKEEFGEDAMILSTQRTDKGVELVATTEDLTEPDSLATASASASYSEKKHQDTLAAAAASVRAAAPSSLPLLNDRSKGWSSGKTKAELAQEMEIANRKMLAARKAETATLGQLSNNSAPLPATSHENTLRGQNNSVAKDNDIRRLYDEISDMRQTIEIQLAELAETQERQQMISQSYEEPESITAVAIDIRQQLNTLGLTKACNDQLLSSLNLANDEFSNKQQLWTEALAELSRKIPSYSIDPVAKGGVYAFLGTTGVGKTTTIAKLAARYVMARGAEDIVILTTDTYRIASHNQLKSLAKILNIKVNVVEDLQQLPTQVERHREYSLVLIDTPGMSYADPLLKPHLQALRKCHDIHKLLVLSASSQYQMMKASLHSYRLAGLDYCVMTKLDECVTLGHAISLLAEQALPLVYTTDGQSVPDDIAIAKSSKLVSRAVALLKQHRAEEVVSRQSV